MMPMVARVDAKEAQTMIADGVQLVDVLPLEIFSAEHLPGARNVPLATFEPSQLDSFDRAETLLVYCFDQH
jgi:rhodanese-related sulfurtransferase